MLYPPGSNCSSLHAEFCLPEVCCVHVRDCASCSAFLPRLCDQRGPFVVKVCWRKLASTEDPPSHPEESTEDRLERRLQADGSIGALWESATDNLVSELSYRRRPRMENAGLVGCKKIERSELGNLQMASCRLVWTVDPFQIK